MDGSTNDVILNIIITAKQEAIAVLTAVRASLAGLTGGFGLAATAVGLLSGAMLVHGIGAAVKYQDTMELLRTQAGATQAQVESYSKSIEQLSMTPVGQSAEALAAGLYHIVSAMGQLGGKTLTTAQGMDTLKVAAEGARVGHANLETVSNALVGVLVSYPQYIGHAADAMAEFNAIVGTSDIRMQELTASIGTGILPVMANAGLTIRDFGAAMAVAGDSQMEASRAATYLRMTIGLIQAPSAAAASALDSIGIHGLQLANDLRQPQGLLVAVDDLKTHLIDTFGKIGPQAVQVLDEAFGKSRGSALMNLLIEQSDRLAGKYQQQSQVFKQWGADVAAAESTVAARFDQLKEIISTLSMVLASALLPVMSLLANVLIPITHGLAEVLIAFPPLTAAVMTALAAFTAFNVVMIGGRLASAAYMFAMRNTFAVISHEGAIMNSGLRMFQAMTGAQLAGVTAMRARAAADKEAAASQELLNTRTQQSLDVGALKEAQAVVAADKEAIYKLALDSSTGSTEAAALAETKLQTTRDLSAATIANQEAKVAAYDLTLAGETDEATLAAAAEAKLIAARNLAAAAAADEAAGLALLDQVSHDTTASLAMQTATEKLAGDRMDVMAAQTLVAADATAVQGARSKILTAQQMAQAASNEALAASSAPATVGLFGIATAATADAGAEGAATVATNALTVSILGLEIGLGLIVAAALAVAAILGYLAYTHIPAVHKAMDDFADRLKTDVHQALVDTGSAFGWLGDRARDAGTDIQKYIMSQVPGWVKQLDLLGHASHLAGEAFGWLGGQVGNFVRAGILSIPVVGEMAGAAMLLDAKLTEQAKAAKAAADEHKKEQAVLQYGITLNGLSAKAYDAQTEAIKRTKAETINYEAELHKIEENALKPLDAELQKTDAAMTAYADKTIAEAKRSSDGMISEINRVRSELAKPLPEMKLIATPNAFVGGTDTSNLTKATSAGPALQLSSDAVASLKQFQQSIAGFPGEFRAGFSSMTDAFKQKLEDAYNTYVGKVNAENQRHEQKIASLNDDEIQKVKAAREAAQQAMDAEQQRYVSALANLNQTHENHLQSILQTFETTFQTMLANFNAAEGALQQKAQAADQTHRDALGALQASEQAKMQAINDAAHKHNKEWVAEHKQALLDAYNREVRLEDVRYQRELDTIQKQGVGLSESFNRHVTSIDATLQNKIDQEKRDYAEAIAKLNEAHRRHETTIEGKLAVHVAHLHQTLEESVRKEDQAHANRLAKEKTVFEDSAKKLGEELNKGLTPGKILADAQKNSQAAYDNALAKATVDILAHGHATRADIAALQKASGDRDRLSKAEAEAQKESGTTAKGTAAAAASATDQLTKLTDAAKKATDNALAALALAISHGATNLNGLVATAVKLQNVQDALASAEAQASELVARAAGDLAAALAAATKTITDDTNAFAKLLLSGHAGDLVPADKSPIRNLPVEDQAKPTGQTQGDAALQQIIKDYYDLDTILKEQLRVDTLVAQKTGDWSKVLSDVETATKTATDKATANLTAAFLGLGGTVQAAQAQMATAATSQEALDQAKRSADAQWTSDMITAAIAAGDLATAFDLLKKKIDGDVTTAFNAIVGAIYTGTGDVKALSAAYADAKAKQDALTAATYGADIAVGDFTGAMSIASKGFNDTLNNAINKYALDLLNHTGDLKADAAAIRTASAAVAGFTAALDAAKAIADVTKPATFDQVTSAINKVADEQAKAIDAQTAVIKTEGDMQVAALDAMATQIEDSTAIIAAQGDVSKAQADAQVKAIQDGAEIYKAQVAISQASTNAERAVAQAQLKLAQDKMHFDMMAAALAVNTAQQQVRAAEDKARLDAADAAAKQKVLADTLVVDQLKVTLAQDNIKVAMDQLSLLSDIDLALGGATDAQKMLEADQQKITADNAAIAQAMQQQAIDQAASAAQDASAKAQEAQDAQNIELAKQAEAQVDNAKAIAEAQDQANIDALQAQASADKNTADTIAAINDTKAELSKDLQELIGIETRGAAGLARLDVTKKDPGSNMMNGWASDSSRQAGVPGQ